MSAVRCLRSTLIQGRVRDDEIGCLRVIQMVEEADWSIEKICGGMQSVLALVSVYIELRRGGAKSKESRKAVSTGR